MNSLHPEFAKRKSATERVYELLVQFQMQWVDVPALAKAGGFCAWRTRVSDARVLAERDGSEIIWNGSTVESKYMLRPKPLGRDASTRIEQKTLW